MFCGGLVTDFRIYNIWGSEKFAFFSSFENWHVYRKNM